MPSYLQRKYTELINEASAQWVNWDPLTEIRVGAYGTADKETGELRMEGNIYDPEFQMELDKHGVQITMAHFPPQEGQVEDDFIVASKGAKRCDIGVSPKADISDSRDACIKTWWLFKQGKRGAILIMHRPRQVRLPLSVLGPLHCVDKLIDKWLVTSTYACPAYCMYLSDKSSDRVPLALLSKGPVTKVSGIDTNADAGLTWQASAPNGLLRTGCETAGYCRYVPLFTVKCPIGRSDGSSRENSWHLPCPPWEPLDEDGEEDPIYFDSKSDLEFF